MVFSADKRLRLTLQRKRGGKKVKFSRLESCFRSNNGRLTSREIPLARMYCCGFQISRKRISQATILAERERKKRRKLLKAKLNGMKVETFFLFLRGFFGVPEVQ